MSTPEQNEFSVRNILASIGQLMGDLQKSKPGFDRDDIVEELEESASALSSSLQIYLQDFKKKE